MLSPVLALSYLSLYRFLFFMYISGTNIKQFEQVKTRVECFSIPILWIGEKSGPQFY